MAASLLELRSQYVWDAGQARYRLPSGRFVSESAVKQSLIRFVRKAQREVESLAREVAAGTIEVAEWQTATAFRLKNIYLGLSAAARGGWEQLDAAAFGQVGSELRRQYAYLRGFAEQVARGKLADGKIAARAGMYVRASQSFYETTRRVVAADVYTMERNILGLSEHCELCKAETAKGWVPIGELVPIGQRTCLGSCRCRYEFRR